MRSRSPLLNVNSLKVAVSPAVGLPKIKPVPAWRKAAASTAAAPRVSPFTSTTSGPATVFFDASESAAASAAVKSSPPANRKSKTTPATLLVVVNARYAALNSFARFPATRPMRK